MKPATALMVIPAMTARRMARAPEAVALAAQLLGLAAVVVGLGLSTTIDTPTGPSIVVAAFALLLMITLATALKRPA